MLHYKLVLSWFTSPLLSTIVYYPVHFYSVLNRKRTSVRQHTFTSNFSMDFTGSSRLTKARSMWSPPTTHSKSPKLELSFLLNHQSDLNTSKSAPPSNTRKESETTTKKKERKFLCEQCPAAFTQSHDLSKHIWYVKL